MQRRLRYLVHVVVVTVVVRRCCVVQSIGALAAADTDPTVGALRVFLFQRVYSGCVTVY